MQKMSPKVQELFPKVQKLYPKVQELFPEVCKEAIELDDSLQIYKLRGFYFLLRGEQQLGAFCRVGLPLI